MKQLTTSFLIIVTVMLTTGFLTQEPRDGRHINLPGWEKDLNRNSSDAVLVGNTLYLTGTTGMDPDTGTLPAEVRREAKIIMDGMQRRLEVVGMTMDDLVSVQVFCSDLSLYGEFNAVYRSYFTGHLPARAFIGSGPLLGGAHFEVMGTAVKR